jgi:DNA mismatch repair protein MutS
MVIRNKIDVPSFVIDGSNPESKRKRTPTQLKREIDSIQLKYPQHILLVQVGMFYEIYDCGNYLDSIAQLLDLRIGIHKSSIGSDHRYSRFAGFPMSQLRNYLKPLLANGYTVAIVNQMEPDFATNQIKRRISRIITPGTVLDEDMDITVDNNFLLSIYVKTAKSRSIGMSWIDVSTGEFYHTKSSLKELVSQISRIEPNEILIPKELIRIEHPVYKLIQHLGMIITPVDSHEILSDTNAHENLVEDMSSALKDLPELELQASELLLKYIRESFPEITPAIRTPCADSKSLLKIDPKTLEALEIMQNRRERTKKGSLLSIIDQATSPSGKRLLRQRLKAPSTNINEINERLDLIELFYDNQNIAQMIQTELSKMKDVERALQKIHLQSGGPSEVSNIVESISHFEKVLTLIREFNGITSSKFTKWLPQKSLYHLYEKYGSLFDANGKLESGKIAGFGTVRSGYCTELDEHREKHSVFEGKRIERMVYLSNLFGVKCNLVFDPTSGPVVEVGKVSDKTIARIQEIAKNNSELEFIMSRKASAYRFKDKTWSSLHRQSTEMEEQLLCMERSLLAESCNSIIQESQYLVEMCKAIAVIDVSCGFALFARKNGYRRPTMVNE